MKVIIGVEDYYPEEDEILVFLAGGITNCSDWQSKVINELDAKYSTERLCVFSPRRKNFPINDDFAAYEQIKWEYKWLERMDIFSMYFSGGESDQPICMYELGRNILRMQNRFPASWVHRIFISVETGYKRKQDVLIQTSLATEGCSFIDFEEFTDTLTKRHAERIYDAYMRLVKERGI